MNINGAFSPLRPRRHRWSDPDPEWQKHERLDGVKVWPKTIDPATGRPAEVIYRHEARDADTET